MGMSPLPGAAAGGAATRGARGARRHPPGDGDDRRDRHGRRDGRRQRPRPDDPLAIGRSTGTIDAVLAGILPVAAIGILADLILAGIQRALSRGRVSVAAT